MSPTPDEIRRLAELGFLTAEMAKPALLQFQRAANLAADGILGPKTRAKLFAEPQPLPATGFDAGSFARLNQAHPLLQAILIDARKEIEFKILDSLRGEDAQNLAYRQGKSKAKFGQSAHNYVPAVAVDLFPAPYDWNNLAAFKALGAVVLRIAKAKKTPVRWGGDWNMDGSTADGWDFPHFELHPWRDFAAKGSLYRG